MLIKAFFIFINHAHCISASVKCILSDIYYTITSEACKYINTVTVTRYVTDLIYTKKRPADIDGSLFLKLSAEVCAAALGKCACNLHAVKLLNGLVPVNGKIRRNACRLAYLIKINHNAERTES